MLLRVGETSALFRVDATLPVNIVSLARLTRWFPGDPLIVERLRFAAGDFKQYGHRFLHFLGTYNVPLRFHDVPMHDGLPPYRSEMLIRFDLVDELIEPLLGKDFLDSVRCVQYHEFNVLLATVPLPVKCKSPLSRLIVCFLLINILLDSFIVKLIDHCLSDLA